MSNVIMDSEATFSYTDGFVEFGAGVVIPTFDIYSDVSLIALLLSIRDAPPGSHHTVAMFKEIRLLVLGFGKIMIIPLILSTFFIYRIPSNTMCVLYFFFSPKNCEY